MSSRILPKSIAVVVAGVVLLGACGDDDDDGGAANGASSGTRTVEIVMRDVEFSPDTVEVAADETVRFVFRNEGAVVHDAFIGDAAAQDEHEADMQESDDGMAEDEGGTDDAEGGITVDPGESGELTYTFSAGDDGLLIGCHQPGHYDAGMKLTVDVT